MISLMSANGEERGLLGNIQQIFQTLGNVLINTFFVTLLARFSSSIETENTQAGYTGAIICVVALMVILILITVFSTKERVHVRSESDKAKGDEVKPMVAVKALLNNKYWVIMFFAMLVIFFAIIFYAIGGVYYSLYIFKDMGQYSWMANSISISQFAIMFVTPFLMAKFGKRWMYAAGMGLLTLGFAGFGLFGTSKPIMIFCNVLKGCGLGISGAMAMGLVADAITYGYLKTGVNAVGMGNAGTSAAQKLGLGLGTAVFGWVMSCAGFKGEYDIQGIAQPASVETAIRFMYNWVPMVMCAVIFIIFVTSFNLDRDLKRLRAEKGIEA
jgi:GPH family glycoside/pentoside/hexuronide:cation symporter